MSPKGEGRPLLVLLATQMAGGLSMGLVASGVVKAPDPYKALLELARAMQRLAR